MSWYPGAPIEYIAINIQDVLLPKQSQQDTVEPHTLVEEEGRTLDYVDEGGCATVYVDEGERNATETSHLAHYNKRNRLRGRRRY